MSKSDPDPENNPDADVPVYVRICNAVFSPSRLTDSQRFENLLGDSKNFSMAIYYTVCTYIDTH